MSLSGTCPGPITVDISGATPGGGVAIAYSFATGSFTIPVGRPCAGTVLGLNSPTLLAVLTADAAGNASFTGNAPNAACTVSVQAVDLGSCATSSVEAMPVPGALDFPSASSAIISSLGFVDAESCGYFWSQARGDSVSETFAGAASISNYSFDCDVTINGLVAGETCEWNVVINGTVVDSFSVAPGQGSISASSSFAPIAGPSYTVTLQMTNEVIPGGGAITLRYAGLGTNDLTLN